MMEAKSLKLLNDILEAIGEIDQFMSGMESLNDIENNLMAQRAIERDLGIIGEAASQFRKLEGDGLVKGIREIVKFRNHIIHAYAYVDMEIIWSVIHDDLPTLKKEVSQLLSLNS